MNRLPNPYKLLVPEASEYPSLLKEKNGASVPLYMYGDAGCLSVSCISVVGSRKMSAYGERILRWLIPCLVRAGLTIVSGLAYGIDVHAHRLAVESGGKCAAVLGSGLEEIYPPSHVPLAASIIQHGGCVISEFDPGMKPLSANFPRRNRIIAGLSMVTLVVEATERSGSLITAREALEAGREVVVIPGDIQAAGSGGINSLIRQGATPITGPEDILNFYSLTLADQVTKPHFTGDLGDLYDLIPSDGVATDDLQVTLGWPIAHLQQALTTLELEGRIRSNSFQWQRIS